MKVNDQFVLRQIAEEYILVPICGEFNFNGIIALNDMGKEIYDLLPTVASDDELIAQLCEGFDAPPEVIEADAREFLAKLLEEKILME